MHSSAAFLFSGNRVDEDALPPPHEDTEAAFPAHRPQRSCPRRPTPRPSIVRTTRRSDTGRLPRPVTVAQLWRSCGREASTAHDGQRGAEGPRRLGDASTLLDGSPCGMVVVCGRVLARQGPTENGSATQRHPYSLIVLTDHTAAVCVLQYHTLLPAEESPHTESTPLDEQRNAGACAELSTMVAVDEQISRSAQRRFSDEPWPDSTLSHNRASVLCGRPDAGSSRACSGSPARGTSPTAAAGVSFRRGRNALAPEELAVYPGDYVVCEGRLAFTDVEKGLRALFTPLSLPSPVPALYRACTANSVTSNAVCAAVPESATRVWLPHAEEPVSWAELEALGLTHQSLPAGTRYLSEAAAGECVVSEHGVSARATSKDEAGAVGAEQDVSEIPFVIKGNVKVLADSNVWMYWTLAALHTHLRFTRGDRPFPLPC